MLRETLQTLLSHFVDRLNLALLLFFLPAFLLFGCGILPPTDQINSYNFGQNCDAVLTICKSGISDSLVFQADKKFDLNGNFYSFANQGTYVDFLEPANQSAQLIDQSGGNASAIKYNNVEYKFVNAVDPGNALTNEFKGSMPSSAEARTYLKAGSYLYRTDDQARVAKLLNFKMHYANFGNLQETKSANRSKSDPETTQVEFFYFGSPTPASYSAPSNKVKYSGGYSGVMLQQISTSVESRNAQINMFGKVVLDIDFSANTFTAYTSNSKYYGYNSSYNLVLLTKNFEMKIAKGNINGVNLTGAVSDICETSACSTDSNAAGFGNDKINKFKANGAISAGIFGPKAEEIAGIWRYTEADFNKINDYTSIIKNEKGALQNFVRSVQISFGAARAP